MAFQGTRLMAYRAPVSDIAFTLKHAAGLNQAIADGIYGDLDEATVDAVLEEAGKFASDVIAPLNRLGDTFGRRRMFAGGRLRVDGPLRVGEAATRSPESYRTARGIERRNV